ncbi:NAD-dependent protein deacetylase of SIR2 family [Lentzea albida]|uniref:NAD-dependent protein deacetylase, SIR2 family n=1 Tax=Lentzea albida TaxID=65499 RepID=A0A1H9DZG5_9PSEU|nr:NAD-dependent protein deacetylase of SIR2 family [Lentzea albida]SEQ18909.1 NAD-dependent protein deacetylase, SIR2 family [Lentzea albida]
MTLRRWLDEADQVLIAAGAGLSAAAGYDYSDAARFAELFPFLHAWGLRARYQLIGLPLPPRLLWGYWSVHVDDIRFGARPNPVYEGLRDLVGDRDHFVVTSNVDGLFARNGFVEDRIWTPQGDYGRYQCETPCTRETWPSRPVVEAALATYDAATGEVTAVPSCPRCGGAVFLNVHKGPEYVPDHYVPAGRRMRDWVRDGVLVLEIGAGYSTPGVIRSPVESLVRTLPSARLVRINRDHADVPADLGERAMSVRADVLEVLARP